MDLGPRQQRQIEALQADVARLRAALEVAQRAGKRQAAPFRKGPPDPAPERPGRKAGDQHGPPAHRCPPPNEQIPAALEAPLPDACPDGGGSAAETGAAHRYQAELPRQPLRRPSNAHVGGGRRCGRRRPGRHPLQTSDAAGAAASQLGPDAQAAIVPPSKDAGLSHGKVAAGLGTPVGRDLTRGASARVVRRAADRREPADGEVVQAARDAEPRAVDETGRRLRGQPAWRHAGVGGRATCYAIDRRRSADVRERAIGVGGAGGLIPDGFASYDRLPEAIHQQGVAHLRRRARARLETATRGAVRFPRQVIEPFTGAVHLRDEYPAGRVPVAVWGAARGACELRLLPLLGGRRVGPSRALGSHLRNHLGRWFPSPTDPAVPATNWQAEQAVRPAVVNRKVWGGSRTEAGARAQGILPSVVQTCKRQARPALDFVSRSVRALGNHLLPKPILLGPR